MPIGIDNVNLRIPGSRTRFDFHLTEITVVGIFPVTFAAQEFDSAPVTGHSYGKVNVARINTLVGRAEGGVIVDEEMQMLRVTDLKPGARKRKRRPCDFFQAEDLAVELLRPL